MQACWSRQYYVSYLQYICLHRYQNHWYLLYLYCIKPTPYYIWVVLPMPSRFSQPHSPKWFDLKQSNDKVGQLGLGRPWWHGYITIFPAHVHSEYLSYQCPVIIPLLPTLSLLPKSCQFITSPVHVTIFPAHVHSEYLFPATAQPE